MTDADSSKRRKQLTPGRRLIRDALIWHAGTVLTGQDRLESDADRMLRRACQRYLKRRRK